MVLVPIDLDLSPIALSLDYGLSPEVGLCPADGLSPEEGLSLEDGQNTDGLSLQIL